jgi:hypothetical protein
VIRGRWKAGCIATPEFPIYISATRFTFARVWHMPFIFWHALRLRKVWTTFCGGVGVSMCADFFARTTYTVSVWQREDNLRAFVVAPIHLRMMRRYRRRVTSSSTITWKADEFNLRDAWREAELRLAKRE